MKSHLFPSIILLALASACGSNQNAQQQLAQAQLAQEIADANCPTYVQHAGVNGGPATTTYNPGCLGAPVVEQAPSTPSAPQGSTLPSDGISGDTNTAPTIDSNAVLTAPPGAPDGNCVQRDTNNVNHYECGTWWASAPEEDDCYQPAGYFKLTQNTDGSWSDMHGELAWFGTSFDDGVWQVSDSGSGTFKSLANTCHFTIHAAGP